MKKVVMLDKNEEVTHDPEQAAIIGEVEFDEQRHFVKETFYFKKEGKNDTGKAVDLVTIPNREV